MDIRMRAIFCQIWGIFSILLMTIPNHTFHYPVRKLAENFWISVLFAFQQYSFLIWNTNFLYLHPKTGYFLIFVEFRTYSCITYFFSESNWKNILNLVINRATSQFKLKKNIVNTQIILKSKKLTPILVKIWTKKGSENRKHWWKYLM